ncbi:glycoside hydrolase family 9 protein [Runella slithyformis]|uniref:Glycoside hydrolase family 9 n=1 Tax=Runella slithyformis (strain ATCC 29530 / DSM 19594 / LMG 11500 / NCIMB 11436 / LSU 4) TaxID=761193 RepID=A0A7U3ZRU9_RUNSL|nr:glycoside hydrolase family 9 protein [Runella slithyformis]AEI52217.1 glycoside hydrolase family 9 [Runella slithyformis DSM 19594]
MSSKQQLCRQLGAWLFCLLLGQNLWAAPSRTVPNLRVDQFGYFLNSRKVAVIIDPQAGRNAATERFSPGTGAGQYQVRRWDNDAIVFSGTLQVWNNGNTQAQSGDKGWWFDFSSVNQAGSYYVFDVGNNVGSYRFEIGDQVYQQVLKAAVRTYFYQRINHAKQTPFTDSKWTDIASHEGSNQDRAATSRFAKGDATTARDLHGGWMDAGDMNKYVTFAEEPVAILLEAYRANPTVFGDNFNIPESGNGVPDLLDEVKWELDFMKRMQDATGTGGLFLKVGVDNYNEAVAPPSNDRRPRYYLPECTSSTISGAVMFSVGASVMRQIPALQSYAQDLMARAERAWARAKVTTNNFTNFQEDCDDQNIKSGDADRKAKDQKQSLVAAAMYLFEITGKAEYKAYAERNYNLSEPVSNEWWGPYAMHIQASYLRFAQLSNVTPSIATAIRGMKAQQNPTLSLNDYNAKRDLYRAFMADAQYHWGSNQVRGNAGVANMDFLTFNVNPLQKDQYREVAESYLHWFHGVNAQGKVMLSNMYAYGAENSLNELFHVWYYDGTDWDNALTSSKGPVPGYVPVGPQNMVRYQGTVSWLRNEPLQKRFDDWNATYPENSWEFTEPAIYNNAPYISLLSRLLTPTSDPSDTEAPTAPTHLTASDLSPFSVKLSWTASLDNRGVTGYEIYQNGEKIGETNQPWFNITTLNPATAYQFTVKAFDFSRNVSPAGNVVTLTTPAPGSYDYSIYGDALRNTISEWSWSIVSNLNNTSLVKEGTKSLKVDVNAAWGALSLRNSEILQTSNYPGGLQFWLYSTTDKTVRVVVNQTDTGPTSNVYRILPTPNEWMLVRIPWSEWNSPTQIQRISFMDGSGGAQSFILDDIRLIAGNTPPDTQAPTVPSNLNVSNITQTSLRLTWTASTDNVGVTAYEVYQNGSLLDGNVTGSNPKAVFGYHFITQQVTDITYNISGLTCGTAYIYTVRAKDAAGNISGNSNTVNVSTSACPGGGTGANEVIYNEALDSKWREWSWSVNRDYNNASPVKIDTKSLRISYTGGWGAWSVIRSSHILPTAQTTIKFWIYATTNKTIAVFTNGEDNSQESLNFTFKPTPEAWQEITVTMPNLGNPAKIKRLTIQSQASGTNQVFLDNIRIETPMPTARLGVESGVLSPEPVEIPAKGRMVVSPNPASEPFQVTVWTPDDDRRANLELYTLAGMNVFSRTVEANTGRNDYTLDIETLSAGMYLVVWQNGSKRLSEKVLIIK